ncbi:Crp/Fnr family transcriptional regulator, partial [Microvirga tunisiensis]
VVRSRLAAEPKLANRRYKPPDADALPPALQVIAHAKEVSHPDTYLPHGSVVSLVRGMGDGRVAEAATFGREGLVGLSFDGIPLQSFGRYLVQIPGAASRIPTARLKRASNARPGIQDMMIRYTETLMVLTLQSAACNAAHSVEARACRWICATCDRVGRDDIPLTHELLAFMLGVQRSSVSVVIHALQSRGLIRQGRGHITIVDRPARGRAQCRDGTPNGCVARIGWWTY